MAARVPDVTIPPAVPPHDPVQARSSWALYWARFSHDRAALAGTIFIVGWLALPFLPPLFAFLVGHPPNELFSSMLTSLGLPKGPNAKFWFGADQAGRDVFVRTLYGARTSLTVSVVGTGAATVLGTITGTVAGYYGGWVDTVILRFVDVFLSFSLLPFVPWRAFVFSVSTQGFPAAGLRP